MNRRIDSEQADKLREELKLGKLLTAFDAETILNIDVGNARKYMQALHKAGETHINDWRRDARVGPWTPIYGWGNEKADAVKPRPLRRIYVRD